MSINGIIVEKNNTLKNVKINDLNLEFLGKKCGFKKLDDFIQQHTFKTKYNKCQEYYFINKPHIIVQTKLSEIYFNK